MLVLEVQPLLGEGDVTLGTTTIALAKLDYRQSAGKTLVSGSWAMTFPDMSMFLGNRTYVGPYYSKYLPPHICTSSEEAWAERCDKSPHAGNLYLFFFDGFQAREPFLVLNGFDPLKPTLGKGRSAGQIKTLIPDLDGWLDMNPAHAGGEFRVITVGNALKWKASYV